MDIQLVEQIVAKAPLPMLLVDESLSVLFVNTAAENLFGKASKETNFDQFLAPMPLPRILFESTGASLAVDAGSEIRQLIDKNGDIFTASVNQERLNEDRMVIYVRNISQPIDYWNKLHKQKRVEDELTRSTLLRSGDFNAALREIVSRSAEILHVERVNIWMIDKDFNSIRSIINYDRASDSVLGNVTLNREELPNYFKLLETEELILTVDSQNDLQTNELVEGYIKRFGIKSMMDIPVRIEGKMVGLICFEELDRIRVWDVSEQKFALTIAQLIAQATETSRRQEAQSEFRKALEEKKLLLREINHRVRNNFNLINDMLNFQTKKAADDFHRKLFEDVRSRITSLNLVHRHLYQSENISEINFRDFLLDLVGNIRSMAMRESVSFITLLDSCKLPLSKAMLAGVIVNELLTNSILPVIDSHEELRVQLKLQVRGKMIIMSIEDNGSWHLQSSTGVGLQLVQALCEQLGSDLQQSHEKGTKFLITFSME